MRTETGRQFKSLRMELYQAIQLSDRTQRDKSWLSEESELRKKAFQEDRASDCQELKNHGEFVVQKLTDLDN